MKKILLIIFTIILILSVNVLAVDISIGMPAINRASTGAVNYTWVNVADVANAAGIITSIEIWAATQLADCKVATFYEVTTNRLTTRDTHIIGTVTAGSKQTFSGLDITVEVGDFIGMVYTAGTVEKDNSGFDGVWGANGDLIPCDNFLFSFLAGDAISLYGYSAVVGWDHKWNTQTISKWNTQEFTKWNGLE